jgi:hypothetical protein
MSQMLKHQNTGLLLFGKLDNTMADLMGTIFIQCPYLCPQGHIVLFTFGNDACLASIACYSSQRPLPKTVQLLSPSNETGGNYRAFDRLDSADG